MAYHCLHTNSFTGETEALAFISTSLQTIGWTLHDDISSTDKVFTSTGEDGNHINAYIRIYVYSTYIRFEAYLWWNNSTHAGTAKAYTPTTYQNFYIDGKSLVIYGDKDVIILDHHIPEEIETKNICHVNPHLAGIDGSKEVSGAGVVYFFAKALNKKYEDLAHIALIGAVGDIQEDNGFKKLNQDILDKAISLGKVTVEKGLRIFGAQTRALHKALEFYFNKIGI